MSKKNVIQIVIIVFALGASGVVLYRGFFSNSSSPSVVIPAESTKVVKTDVGATALEPILPYGNNLDFDKTLNRQHLQFGLISYPKLDPSVDVGISAQELFTNPTPNQ